MSNDTYIFNAQQLRELLYGTIQMFQEYRDIHGHTEEASFFDATNEMIEGLDAERELHAHGEIEKLTLQQPAPGFAQPSMFPSGEDAPLFTLPDPLPSAPPELCGRCNRRPQESGLAHWLACDTCGAPVCDTCVWKDKRGGWFCSQQCMGEYKPRILP